MKFIKGLVCSFAILSSVSSFAGVEEICNMSATRSVELKNFFNSHPNAFKYFIDDLQKSNESKELKVRMRERSFWVYNRRSLSDEDMQRLAFINCLTELK